MLGRMTKRVAVLSDIHGVLPALEAVLAEPDVRAADAVVLIGDLLAGPQPVETLELLRGLGDRAVWMSGNADRELVELRRGDRPATGEEGGPPPIDVWAAGQLSTSDAEFLAGLPPAARLEVDGLGPVLFCHATPRDDTEVVLVDSRPGRWAEVLADVDADVRALVCGHTHMPFVRLVRGLLVVNPGSVGMPYGRPGAHWALLPGPAAVRRKRWPCAGPRTTTRRPAPVSRRSQLSRAPRSGRTSTCTRATAPRTLSPPSARSTGGSRDGHLDGRDFGDQDR